MRKLLLVGLLAVGLGGCAQLQALQALTGTTVTPTQAIVAANAFNAAEAGATGYLTFCKSNLTTPACSADNRRAVIKYTRAGRAARVQIETYIQTSTSIPVAVYNSMVAAVNDLKATPVINY